MRNLPQSSLLIHLQNREAVKITSIKLSIDYMPLRIYPGLSLLNNLLEITLLWMMLFEFIRKTCLFELMCSLLKSKHISVLCGKVDALTLKVNNSAIQGVDGGGQSGKDEIMQTAGCSSSKGKEKVSLSPGLYFSNGGIKMNEDLNIAGNDEYSQMVDRELVTAESLCLFSEQATGEGQNHSNNDKTVTGDQTYLVLNLLKLKNLPSFINNYVFISFCPRVGLFTSILCYCWVLGYVAFWYWWLATLMLTGFC